MGKLLASILYIGMYFSPIWYKIRYSHLEPFTHDKREMNIPDIKREVKTFLENFTYQYDGAKELWDAIVPPDFAYEQLTNSRLYDDCDGFHAGVYEMLKLSGYHTCLITSLNEHVMTNHVMVLFKKNQSLYLVNYDKVIKVIDDLNGITQEGFISSLKDVSSKECGSTSYFVFGQVFTDSRWFKRINLYKFFKSEEN
jgi:hypothetical protein